MVRTTYYVRQLYVPGGVLSTSHILMHLFFSTTPKIGISGIPIL